MNNKNNTCCRYSLKGRLKILIIFIYFFCFVTNISAQIFSNPITEANPSTYNPFTIGQVVNANITVSGIGRGNGIAAAPAADRYSASNWNTTSTIDPDDYFEFTLTPNAGFKINFSNFVYAGQISGGSSIHAFRSSIDGFTANIGAPNAAGTTINLSAAAYQNLSTSVTFRFYTYGVSAATRTYSINSFTFNGSVIAGSALSASPLTGFGNVCVNTVPGTNTFTITGSSLNTANITVGPLAGFGFSTTNGSFSPSLSLTHAAGSYTQLIYVQFSPTLVQSYNGNIIAGGGGASAINVPVAGNSVNTPPSINNGTAGAITSSSATISASITNIGCSAISAYGIEYSTTTPFANGTGTQVPGSNLSGGNFSVNLAALAPSGQTFYFHTYATNSGGTTYGSENSFTLLASTPTLSVPPAGAGALEAFGNICINTATAPSSFILSGSVLNGSNITIGPLARFTFSASAGGPYTNTLTLTNGGAGYSYNGGVLSVTIYVIFSPVAVQSYNGNIPVIGGGAPAINVAASGSGVNTPVTLTTTNAVFITTNGATAGGEISDEGCGVLLDYGIEYSLTNGFSPGTGTQVSASNLSGGSFSVNLSGLASNTTYYYYAYAVNGAGTSYGTPQNSFLTADIPVKLVIISVTPVSPTVNTSFSVTVQAQDALGNPVNVTSNTDITLTQSSGTGLFSFPGTPSGTIPAGGNTILIDDISYGLAENNVGLTATASSGMTGLGTSIPRLFNVIPYVGPNTFIWSGNGASAWINPDHWQGGTYPGAQGAAAVNQHVASFTNLAGLYNIVSGGCGIFMTNVDDQVFNIGAIYFTNSYSTSHFGNIVPVGNSSSVNGTLRIHGTAISNLGGTGVNYSNVLLANYINSPNPTQTFEIRNSVGGSAFLTLNLVNAGQVIAGAGRTININTLLTGSQSVTFTGGGTFSLTPSGAASVNSFSGDITVANGTLIAGNSGAINMNVVTLGSAPANAGKLKLNGNNISLGGLGTAGTSGNLNTVDNGASSATLTINTTSAYIFNGALNNGSAGILSLTKTGTGSVSLTGLNSYTGLTTISNGTLILGRAGGGTIPGGNSITATGNATIRISSDQTISNLILSTGAKLQVDAGVILTITGSYSPATCFIQNDGTIKLQGAALQSFPGVAATVTSMNNLMINNAFNVNLNKSLNIAGVLTLTNGIFTVGANTLTINNPIASTVNNLAADNTSSITIAGTAPGVNIPASVSQLKNITVSNTAGTSLQGNINVTTAFIATAGAGIINAGTNTFNGSANVTMAGGNLVLAKNSVVLPEFSGVYLLTGGTVTFNGTGIATDAQTIRPVDYFNLASTSNGDRVLSPGVVTGIKNIFTPFTNSYTVINSTIDFKGGAQNIPSFTFYNLTLSGGAVTKLLTGDINIQATLSLVANAKLNLGNLRVTLKSTAANTANIDKISTANSFIYGASGEFIVERFIETGPLPNHGKSWQLLATPAFGKTLNTTWQEGSGPLLNNTPGFGTTLTSDKAGAVGRGYDFYTPGTGSSVKTYNVALNKWNGIDDGSTPTTSLQLANRKGYMIFIRGDRSVLTYNAPANTVTMRAKGKIYSPGTDAPPVSTVPAGKLESVGNPYASAIDFLSLVSTSAGLDSKYYVWDPMVPSANGYGAYQTISSTNGYMPVPGSTGNYPGTPYTKIQSGQAFFVASTSGGSVTFSENNKTSANISVFRPADFSRRQFLRTFLCNSAGFVVDGNVVAFDPVFSNGIDADDAIKPENFGENFGISSHGNDLSVEARGMVINTDTIFFKLGNLRTQAYQLRFAPANMSSSGLTAFLVDQYLHKMWKLSLYDSTRIDFNITQDAASGMPDRFFVVFKPSAPVLPVTINISASRNSDKQVLVKWNVINELSIARYETERSADENHFITLNAITPAVNSGSSQEYNYLDQNSLPQSSFYRIRAIGSAGNIIYSKIVKVGEIGNTPSVTIFPNPVEDGNIKIRYASLQPGDYNVSLVNSSGQTVYSKPIKFIDISGSASILLPHKPAAGIYQFLLSRAGEYINQQVWIK